MNFGRKQLEKYGWTDGQGLGKNEDGIASALKPSLKFDKAGLGHDGTKEFTDNWWESMFNNAIRNVVVESTSAGTVQVKSKKNLSGTRKIKHIDNVSIDSETLLEACGKRTAHKGSRHGIDQRAKLDRLDRQERILLKKMRAISLDETKPIEKKIRKIRHLRTKTESDCDSSTAEPNNTAHDTVAKSPKISLSPSQSAKKMNNKSVSFSDSLVSAYVYPADSPQRDEGIDNDWDNGYSATLLTDTFDVSKAERRRLNRAKHRKNKKQHKKSGAKETEKKQSTDFGVTAASESGIEMDADLEPVSSERTVVNVKAEYNDALKAKKKPIGRQVTGKRRRDFLYDIADSMDVSFG